MLAAATHPRKAFVDAAICYSCVAKPTLLIVNLKGREGILLYENVKVILYDLLMKDTIFMMDE